MRVEERDYATQARPSSRVNKLRPTQAQTVIAAAILRHLHAVISTGQTWNPAIATHSHTATPAAA
jgi:transposase